MRTPGIIFGSAALVKATYLAPDCGSTRSSSLLKENPAQGITIDHASTHRMRYTRSSGGLILRSISKSNVVGLPHRPSTWIFQPSVLKLPTFWATPSLSVLNS